MEGASSLAKHFLSGANVSFSKTVQSIARRANSGGSESGAGAAEDCDAAGGAAAAAAAPQWTVSTAGGEASQIYDGIVLTAPMPQVLAMGGDVQDLITSAGVRAKLEAVTYSSRWALAVEFAPSAWEQVKTLQWDAR